jgi:hypothetical protein
LTPEERRIVAMHRKGTVEWLDMPWCRPPHFRTVFTVFWHILLEEKRGVDGVHKLV